MPGPAACAPGHHDSGVGCASPVPPIELMMLEAQPVGAVPAFSIALQRPWWSRWESMGVADQRGAGVFRSHQCCCSRYQSCHRRLLHAAARHTPARYGTGGRRIINRLTMEADGRALECMASLAPGERPEVACSRGSVPAPWRTNGDGYSVSAVDGPTGNPNWSKKLRASAWVHSVAILPHSISKNEIPRSSLVSPVAGTPYSSP
jgi:hypothetical protein